MGCVEREGSCVRGRKGPAASLCSPSGSHGLPCCLNEHPLVASAALSAAGSSRAKVKGQRSLEGGR